MSRQKLVSRMQALSIDVEPDVADRQIAAVLRELREAPTASGRAPHRPRRRALAMLAVAFALMLPAASLAAEQTVPGDVLYPVKQSTEWMRSLVDSRIVQQHRVEELEIVIDRGAPIGVVADRFVASITTVDGGSPELIQRVDRARAAVLERYGVDLGPAMPRSGPDGATGDPEAGNGQGPRSQEEQRTGEGATNRSAPSTSPVSIEPPIDGSGPGTDTDTGTSATTTGSTTRSTTGQPDDAHDNESGGSRP